jgi:hypothetical protein
MRLLLLEPQYANVRDCQEEGNNRAQSGKAPSAICITANHNFDTARHRLALTSILCTAGSRSERG